jgi:YHS domain-containing protein
MKAIPTILVTALAAAVFIGCNKNEPAAPKADAPKTEAPKSGADGKAAGKPYPLEVCIVSGEKLGSMGKPHVIVHEGQEIKFCCSGCEPDFKKEPAKFLAKLAPKK